MVGPAGVLAVAVSTGVVSVEPISPAQQFTLSPAEQTDLIVMAASVRLARVRADEAIVQFTVDAAGVDGIILGSVPGPLGAHMAALHARRAVTDHAEPGQVAGHASGNPFSERTL